MSYQLDLRALNSAIHMNKIRMKDPKHIFIKQVKRPEH